MNTENPEKDAFLSDSPGRQTDFKAGMNLTGVGRDIDEQGGIRIEITSDRTRDDIAGNRPGSQLREKILNLPDSPGVYMLSLIHI